MTTREGSPSRATSPRPVKLSDSVPVATMSTVDYAKVRYQAAQASNIVSETRSRFENGQPAQQWRSEWSPARYHNTDDASETVVGNPFVQPEASPESPTELLPRKGRKLRKSPEPAGSNGGSAPLPHPQLTTQQRQHLRERSLYQQNMAQVPAVAASSAQPGVQYTASGIPIRPFLTRGSVAERVLIFEKCPTMIEPRDKTAGSTAAGAEKKRNNHAASVNAWRHSSSDVHTKTQGYTKDNNKENRVSSPVISPKSTLRRQAKATSNSSALLPRFYFPLGRPNNKEQHDTYTQNITAAFRQIPNGQATLEHFGAIAKAAGLPLYWKMPLFLACGGEKLCSVTLETFMETWKKMVNNCHDEAARFVYLLTISNPGGGGGPRLPKVDGVSPVIARTYLVPEDFVPLIQDVVDTHPGLTFLKEASEFHSRYVQTVIARIFYNVNRTWSGRLSLAELRQSNFLATLRLLEDEEDINQITDYFSYEHFYVIYCKFWELDKDHDLHIDKKDLARHNDHAISTRMIDRIFSGAVTRGPQHNKLTKLTSTSDPNSTLNRMSYAEFVWFLMSEEDKRHPTAVEYWFRCMDLDGDGYLSMYELEYFYEEQLQRMEALGIETLPFEDCLCQMLDMVRPSVQGKISLSDLKRCHMTPIFFDTFFNLEKYLDHEQRDPFASQRDPDSEPGEEVSDWDRYAAEEYELLVAEEGVPIRVKKYDTLGDEVSEDHVDNALDPNLSASYAPLFTVPQCAIINPVVANAEYQY
nr:EOG090X00JH [Eulimnadia texana]